MEHISGVAADDVISMFETFLQSSLIAIQKEPVGAVFLFALAVFSAVLARSAILFVPTATLALFAVLSGANAETSHRLLPLLLGAIALLILCAWTATIRRRFSRLRSRLKGLMDEHAAAKDLLAREVAWRQAADDEELA